MTVCIFWPLVATNPTLIWSKSSSEACHACLDCEVTAMKEGQVSIIATDMGHWPGLEVVSFSALRYAWHAARVGNQQQPLAKHGWNLSCPVSLPTQLLWKRLRFLPCMVHWSRLEVISFKRTEECEARHKHQTPHTQLHNNHHAARRQEGCHFG